MRKRDEALDKIVCYFDNNHFESKLAGCKTALACYLQETIESALSLMTGLWWKTDVGDTPKHT